MKLLNWLDNYFEELLMIILLILMTLIMGVQVCSRYMFNNSLSWSEEVTRYLFIWSGFISISYCTKKCISIKIEQFVEAFPKKGRAIFKIINHTIDIFLLFNAFFSFIFKVFNRKWSGKSSMWYSYVFSTICTTNRF